MNPDAPVTHTAPLLAIDMVSGETQQSNRVKSSRVSQFRIDKRLSFLLLTLEQTFTISRNVTGKKLNFIGNGLSAKKGTCPRQQVGQRMLPTLNCKNFSLDS
jgi:hypothetical protein